MATLVIKLVHRIGRHVTALNIAKTQVSGSILMADFVNAGYFAVRPDESGVVSPCSHVVDVAPLTYWLSDWEAEATTFGVEEDLLQDAKGWLTKNRSETLLLRFCDRAPAMVIGMSIHRDIVSLMLNDFEGQRPEGSSAYELLRLGKPPAPPTAVLGFDLLDVAPDIDHTWNCYRRFYEMFRHCRSRKFRMVSSIQRRMCKQCSTSSRLTKMTILRTGSGRRG